MRLDEGCGDTSYGVATMGEKQEVIKRAYVASTKIYMHFRAAVGSDRSAVLLLPADGIVAVDRAA